MKSRLFVCVIILLAISMSASAGVLEVPTTQYPDIQTAVNASRNGDVVVVRPISFNGGNYYTVPSNTGVTIPAGVTNITIKSFRPTDPSFVAATVIDCRGSSRAFTFVDDQQSQVIVEGFTIINGYATGIDGNDASFATYDPNDPNTWDGESVTDDGCGGAIYIGSTNNPAISIAPVIRNCVFQNCHVYGAVGGAGITGPVISDPNYGDIGDSMPGGEGGIGDGNGLGGAIYCGQSSTPTIVDCLFSSNFAHGGIGGPGGGSSNVAEDRYPGNGGNGGNGIGDGKGGAIYADMSSDPNITRCTFTNNTATVGVAGVGGSHGTGKTDDDSHPVFDGADGSVITNLTRNAGAIYYNTALLNNLNSSIFEYNDAGDNGGALYCTRGSLLNINAGCQFNHNQALNGSGGAIMAEMACTLNLTGQVDDYLKFLQNSAMFDGGAIFANATCTINMLYSSLNANTAGIVNNDVVITVGNGGAIDVRDGSTLKIDSCSFGLNKATNQGGAINAMGVSGQYCNVAMRSTSVTANEALVGGGVYFDRFMPIIDPTDPDLIKDCTFISNLGRTNGGGLYLMSNMAGLGSKIYNCDITDNSVFDAGGSVGGGAYINSAETTFENCRILQNSSTWSGGGLYFIGMGQTGVKNCLFVGNSAVNDGAAISSNLNISLPTAVMQFTNNTFAENTITSVTGEGGTVYNNDFCSPIISDCIFYKCNKAAVYESDSTSQSTLNNNLFYGNVDGDYHFHDPLLGELVYSGAVSINGLSNANDNIDGNPMFVSSDLGNYYLSQTAAGQMQTSPAVDAGSTTAALAGLDDYTTRTDSLANPTQAGDAGAVDLGYHSPKTANMPKYHLDIVIENPFGTVTTIPEMENNDFYAGTVVRLVADPDLGWRISSWSGTESDSSTELTNTVIMSMDKTVRVVFEQPKTLIVKDDGEPYDPNDTTHFANIQDAIEAAQDGDTILVYPDMYTGPVIQIYKNVYLRSLYPESDDPDAQVIIDRSPANGVENHRGFIIDAIIDNTTVIDGFVLQNCYYTTRSGASAAAVGLNGADGESAEGGAIYIDRNASPIIKNCVIRGNNLRAGNGGRGYDSDETHNAGRGGWGAWAKGGAVYCGTGSSPQFIRCKFQDNTATGGNGGDGGDKAHAASFGNYGGNWSSVMSPEFPNIDPRYARCMPSDYDYSMELWQKWTQLADARTDPIGGGTGLLSHYEIDYYSLPAFDNDNPYDPTILRHIIHLGYFGDFKWYSAYGGAVYCGPQSDVNFIDCEFTDNQVVGGMSGRGGSCNPKRREPQVKYELPTFGGAVYCAENSTTLFEGCTISNNVTSPPRGAERREAFTSHGGGICSETTADVVLHNCHISNNQSNVGGGYHFSDSSPIIEDCNFVNNTAEHGGGLYGDHGIADILRCQISNNSAETIVNDPNVIIDPNDPNYVPLSDTKYCIGGGIHISDADVNVVDCVISENTAEAAGGGMYLIAGGYQSIFNCLIKNNVAGKQGAGIEANYLSRPVISNCTIADNEVIPYFWQRADYLEEQAEVAGPSTYGGDLTQEELDEMMVANLNSPPVRPQEIALSIQVQPVSAVGDVVIEGVPTSQWTYGCAATAAGMIFGYYDRNDYPNIYTGPTNGGVAPLRNLGQGDTPGNPIAGSCSLIATEIGVDGRTTNGHVEDYWISYLSEGPDPWDSTGIQHQWGDCIADYMGTNQWKWDGDIDGNKDYSLDGETRVWYKTNGQKLYDFIPPSAYGYPQLMASHGMRLFAQSRGYMVAENYTQQVDSVVSGGFTFNEYKAEIDAGYPVMILVTGHAMTGVGYNDDTQEIILHDTWDNQTHRMTWGGYYGDPAGDMLHQGVLVIHLETPSNSSGGGLYVANSVNATVENSIIWNNGGSEVSVGVESEPASVTITYSNVGPKVGAVATEPGCTVYGWDPNSYPDSNGWAPDTHNINQDPLFISDYLLTQISAGQLEDSPSIDAGSDFASTLGFDGYTTRTDSGPDEDIVDMGYHHPMFTTEIKELNFIAVTDPDLDIAPVIDPCGITYHTQYTTVELTVSDAPVNYQIQWSGTEDDTLLTTTNTVHMDIDKTVVVGFVKNYCILDVTVDGENGGFELSPLPDANGVYPRNTVVTIKALPDAGYRVKQWTGTIDDDSVALENQVVMDSDKTVTVSFETPGIITVPGGDAGSLQQAINVARELDTIVLLGGTYRVQDGFEIINKNITISSSSPDDPNTVAGTIIEQLHVEGGSHGEAFYMWDVGPQTVLNGLTIRNFHSTTVSGDDGETDPNTFENMCGRNSPTNRGNAITCFNASPTVKNCRFVNCGVAGGNGGNGAAGVDGQPNGGHGGWPGGAHGGAVAMYPAQDYDTGEMQPSNPTFINCEFIDCYARGGNGGNGGDGLNDDENGIHGDAGLGGGWYYGEPFDYYGRTRIYWPFGYHFDGTYGDGQYDEYTRYSGLGGAVFVGADCKPVFKGCYFQGNTTTGGFCGIMGLNGGADLRMAPAGPLKIDSYGGAVYCDTNSAPQFYDCNFVDNEADANIPADNDDAFISFGGAVAARDDAKPVFKNCDFSNNFAAIGGAIFYCDTDAQVIDCNIVNNAAFHGGGLYCSDSDTLIDNSTITRNFTTQPPDPNIFPDEIFGLGGGIFISASDAQVVDCNISMNSTGASGGGVYFSDSDSSLKNCLITSNAAERDGAGVSVNWLSELNVSNCTVANNTITGLNFMAPYNYGGGLYCGYGSYTNIIDSIFWNNTASSGHQLAVAAIQDDKTQGSTMEVSYSIVLGGQTSIFVADECNLIWDDTTNKYIDPFFVSSVRGDYFLSSADIDDANQTEDSPAIDAGSAKASDVGLQAYTTRTDGGYDQDDVDMGYHYSIGNECRICDLDSSGMVEFGDLAILAQYWLFADTQCTVDNNWCQGANIVADERVDFKDYSRIMNCWMVTSSGMRAKWLVEPYTKTITSISMTAKTVVSSWGWDVEYYFECLNDGDANSGWQEEPEYVATGLAPETQYDFRFKVRDLSPNNTESEWSVVRSALTGEDVGDITPPTPNPMTWELQPTPTGPTTVTMTASIATDDVEGTPVQYKFFSADANGTSSGWLAVRDYTDTNAEPNSICTYYVVAKDMSSNQNETEPSVSISVLTPPEQVTVDVEAPLPNPSTWAVEPYESGGYHGMEATQASDSSTGGNDPVWYKFEVVNGYGTDSQWQRGDLEYDVPGYGTAPGYMYIYQHTGNVAYIVKTCDSIPGSNPPQPNTAATNVTIASEPAATYLP